MQVNEAFKVIMSDIESRVVEICYMQREMTDEHIDVVYHALLRSYEAENTGRVSLLISFENAIQQHLFDSIFNLCEWHLGRCDINDVKTSMPLTLTELVGCIQSLRHRVYLWSGEHSNRGYLDYVHFIL